MDKTYKTLAHRAGCIRKKYKLTPYEAVCCALWLVGEREENLDRAADRILAWKELHSRYGKEVMD